MYAIFSQQHNHKHPVFIMAVTTEQHAQSCLASLAVHWMRSKKGRRAQKAVGCGHGEICLLYTDGKLAGSIWMDSVMKPVGEAEHAPPNAGGWHPAGAP